MGFLFNVKALFCFGKIQSNAVFPAFFRLIKGKKQWDFYSRCILVSTILSRTFALDFGFKALFRCGELKGNLVRIESCPRNCKPGFSGSRKFYHKSHCSPQGNEKAVKSGKPGDLPFSAF
jgi:hypothetical protein